MLVIGNSTNNSTSWRAKRILSMIPSSDSEPSDIENNEENEKRIRSRIPSCRTLSPGLEEFLNGLVFKTRKH